MQEKKGNQFSPDKVCSFFILAHIISNLIGESINRRKQLGNNEAGGVKSCRIDAGHNLFGTTDNHFNWIQKCSVQQRRLRASPGGIMEYYKEAPPCLFPPLCNVPFQAGMLRDCFGTVTAGWKEEMEKAGGRFSRDFSLFMCVCSLNNLAVAGLNGSAWDQSCPAWSGLGIVEWFVLGRALRINLFCCVLSSKPGSLFLLWCPGLGI